MAGEALRSLLASFTVEVDPTGALPKGEKAVDHLAASMRQLDTVAKTISDSISTSFAKMSSGVVTAADSIEAAVRRASAAAQKFSALGQITGMTGPSAGANSSAWGQLQGLAAARDAPMGPQYGPVRPTRLQNLGARALQFGRGAGGAIGGIGSTAAGALKWVTSLHGALISLGAGTAVRGLMQVVDHLGGIGEAAAKLGVSGSEFQRLDVLARQNATSVQALGTAFRTLATTAVNPTEESTEALRRLGVQVKADDGTFKTRQDLFFETATALADVQDETVRAALAQKLYGRSALELAPLLAAGRAGIEAQRAELEKMPVAADSAIAAADALSDRWATVSTVLLGQFAPVLEDTIIPAFQQLTTWLLKAGDWLARFLKESHYLQYLGVFLKNVTAPFRVIFDAVRKLFGLKGDGVSFFAALTDGFGRLSVAIGTVMQLPFLLYEDWQYYLDGKDSAIGRIIAKAPGMFAEALELAKPYLSAFLDWFLGQAAEYGGKVARVLVPGFAQAADVYNAVTGGGSIPVPGGAAPAPAERQGTTVIEAPRSVTVNMGANASPGEVAKRVGVELERDRAAVAAGVP